MSCEMYEQCKRDLFPTDPMIRVPYPNGQYKTICHDCGRNNPAMLPKQTAGTSAVIKDLNTRIAVLEKQLEERPPHTSKEIVSEF